MDEFVTEFVFIVITCAALALLFLVLSHLMNRPGM